jgi:hypothetical protein
MSAEIVLQEVNAMNGEGEEVRQLEGLIGESLRPRGGCWLRSVTNVADNLRLIAAVATRCPLRFSCSCLGLFIAATEAAIRLSAAVPSKFSLYITFLRHIINISPPIFSSPAAVPPILSPYTTLQLLNIII